MIGPPCVRNMAGPDAAPEKDGVEPKRERCVGRMPLQEDFRRPGDAGPLSSGDRLGRGIRIRPGFDLGENQGPAAFGDQVDLTGRTGEPPRDDAIALGRQQQRGNGFGPMPGRPGAPAANLTAGAQGRFCFKATARA